MSQAGGNSSGGGGGSGIQTIDLDTGSITGSTVTLSGGTTGLTTTGSGSTGDLTGTLGVPNGGTGDTSFTAYAVICGGTTSTGSLQSVSGVGSARQILTSNGAGALPTWASSGGSLNAFAAVYTGDQTNVTGNNVPFILKPDTTLVSTGFSYDNTTGIITINTTGIFYVIANIQLSGITNDHNIGQWLVTNQASTIIGDSEPGNLFTLADGNTQFNCIYNTVLSLTATNTIYLTFTAYGGPQTIGIANTAYNSSFINIFKIG